MGAVAERGEASSPVRLGLRERVAAGTPIRVGVIGTGPVARGLIHQLMGHQPGLALVALATRRPSAGQAALRAGGETNPAWARDADAVRAAAARGHPVLVDDALLLTQQMVVDVLVDATCWTGGALVAREAIAHGTHVVQLNLQVEATVGALLALQARRAGVVYTGCAGEPAAQQVALYHFAQELSLTPLLCAQVSGRLTRSASPDHYAAAGRWEDSPARLVAGADGTRLACEQAAVANATGLTVAQPGMMGVHHPGPLEDLGEWFDPEELAALGGVVDYVTGASPATGCVVLCQASDREQRRYLEHCRLGRGPLYSLYTPHRLGLLQAAQTIARAVLFGQPTVAAAAGPSVEVVATAKVDLHGGQLLDGAGGYLTYGQCDSHAAQQREQLLPLGLAMGSRLLGPVARGQVLTYADVALPEGRPIDALRREQQRAFPVTAPATPAARG